MPSIGRRSYLRRGISTSIALAAISSRRYAKNAHSSWAIAFEGVTLPEPDPGDVALNSVTRSRPVLRDRMQVHLKSIADLCDGPTTPTPEPTS